MPLSRRSFLSRAAALAAFGGLDLPAEDPASAAASDKGPVLRLASIRLRGYGTLSAAHRTLEGGLSSLTHITCESGPKALLTQAKYLSDLERLPGLKQSTVVHHGRPIPVRRTPASGATACYSRGKDVLILSAGNEKALARLLDSFVPSSAAPADFTPRVPIPMYLDRWDRYGLLLYMAPDMMPPGTPYLGQDYDYSDALKFAKDNGPAGLVLWSNPLSDDFSEAITNEQSWGWVQENARKMGIPLHMNTQIQPPQLWLANRYREQTMLKSPQFLGGYYGVDHDSAGVGAISWLSQEAEDAQLGVFQEIVRRFAPDPNIVGWLEPHGETGEMPQAFFLESGPYADEVWRTYLKGRHGTLAALSLRWHGDAGFLKSWADVHIPEVAEFAGFGPEAIDLRGTWRVRYLPAPDGHAYSRDEARGLPSPPPTKPVPPEWLQPGFDDSSWDELTAPGNDRMLFMARSPLVYRRTLDIPAAWLTAHPQVTLTVWDMVNRDHDATIVTINGKAIKEQSHRVNEQHWGQFDITDALKPGPNLIVLQMPRAIICYRAYLSGETPRQYPHLGPQKNAQWVDVVDWNIQSRGAQIRRGGEMIRQADANSSINFMAANDYVDPVRKACQDYGGRFHDTGAMAGFWTDQNTLMMTGAGLPVTAEPGNGAPNPREFQLFWGRWLTEGVTGVHYFQNWGEIAWNPEVLKVFEASRPMYEAVGKFHLPFARVAVLFTLQCQWLTGFPWEPGAPSGYYSGYNSASHLLDYCPRDGICAMDFGTPVMNKYRVVIDTNSSIMDEELLTGIEKFVRGGGVFITYGDTGRHTPTQADAWPISKLTGYRVTRDISWGDGKSVSAAPGQTVLTPADLPPKTRSTGLALQQVAPECTTLAVWDDGTVAMGIRPLGAGAIVHVGPVLGGDQFSQAHGALLRHAGVMDRVPAVVGPHRGLHLRHYIGNTGLHDVWVLFNESDDPVTTDLTFLPGVHPASLNDIVTGQTVDIARDPAGDAVHGLTLKKWETRMFLSPREDTAAAPLEWLSLQRGWWQGTVKPPAKHLPTPAEMQRFTLDLNDGWAFKSIPGLSDEEAAALARPDLDDSKWERRRLDLWLTPGDKSQKRLLLRRKFTVPAGWTDGPVTLCADIPYAQFFYDTRLFVDGQPWNGGRKTVDGPYLDTLDGILKPGTTHLLTLDIQSKSTLTGSRGPIWLTYLPDPQARQDLAGTWTTYSDPLRRTGEVQLPGKVKGAYYSRTVDVDGAHRNKNVIIHIETSDRMEVMVNSKFLRSSALVRQHIFSFNVTPFIQFGGENLIELVSDSSDREKTLQVVELRFYDRGLYP